VLDLQLVQAKKFWRMYSEYETVVGGVMKNTIDEGVFRFLNYRGIPPELWRDILHTILRHCACKAGDYDETKSALPTWINWQVKGLLTNVYRNSGGLNPLRSDVTFTELEVDSDESEDLSIEEAVVGSLDTSEQLSEELNEELVYYARALEKHSEGEGIMVDIFNILRENDFDIPDRQIAHQYGVSSVTVGKYRKKIFAELKFRLIKRGITP